MIGSGTTLSGRFELLEPIGAGGMSVVYKARHLAMNQLVCVKVLREQIVSGNSGTGRLHAEAKALGALQHPNILRCLAMDSTAECTFLVTEFIDGIGLDALVQSGPLANERIIEIFSQLADGLHYAHRNNVVHRDLKPSNIMISNVGDVEHAKILDFGIAKILDNEQWQKLTKSGSLIGTPQYMAPEQCETGTCDVRSDIYSLGCMLYECLTGKPPFTAETALEVMMKHLHEPPPVEPGHIGLVAAKAMAKDAAQRFQTAAEFRAALEDPSFNTTLPNVVTKRAKLKHATPIASVLAALLVAGTVYWNLQHPQIQIQPQQTNKIEMPYHDPKAQLGPNQRLQEALQLTLRQTQTSAAIDDSAIQQTIEALLNRTKEVKAYDISQLCMMRGRIAYEAEHRAENARQWFNTSQRYATLDTRLNGWTARELVWMLSEQGDFQGAVSCAQNSMKQLDLFARLTGPNAEYREASGIVLRAGAEILCDNSDQEELAMQQFKSAAGRFEGLDSEQQVICLHEMVVNSIRLHPDAQTLARGNEILSAWQESHAAPLRAPNGRLQAEYDFAQAELTALAKNDVGPLIRFEHSIADKMDRDIHHPTDDGLFFYQLGQRSALPKTEIMVRMRKYAPTKLEEANKILRHYNDKYARKRIRFDLDKLKADSGA